MSRKTNALQNKIISGSTVAVPTFIEIPASPDEADEMLSSLGGLATATGWARSAIVRARCEKGSGGPRRPKETGKEIYRFSLGEYAELGIVGLSSKPSVIRYYNSWDFSGMPEPELGKRVNLPNIPFPTPEELAELQQKRREEEQEDKEAEELLQKHVRDVRKYTSLIYEYKDKFWNLLDETDLDLSQEAVESWFRIWLECDPDRLERVLEIGAEILAGEEEG